MCHDLDEAGIITLIAKTLNSHRTSTRRIRDAVTVRIRAKNRRIILDMLDASDMGIESNLEFKFFTDVEKAHGLPTAKRQASLSKGRRSDGFYEDFLVIVEVDGREYHSGANIGRDYVRDNDHSLLGYLTLRFTWWQVYYDPCGVARTIAKVLRDRGWTGEFVSCKRCRFASQAA